MKRGERRWAVLLGLGLTLAGCPSPEPIEEEEDAGVEPYDGPTSTGVIPTFDPDAIDAGDPVIDAGMVTIETRCCDTRFSISDDEPADAVGVLVGQNPVFESGIALTRGDGGWTASACFPINASAFYWYRFTWDGGVFDAGTVDLEDGGAETTLIPLVGEALRASDSEPVYTDSDGVRRNYYRAVESCDGLDGGVP